MATFTFTSNQSEYHTSFVARLIEEYIFRLKGVRVKIRLGLIRMNDGHPEEIKLFEQAAGYAIPAYEGGWKLKTTT